MKGCRKDRLELATLIDSDNNYDYLVYTVLYRIRNNSQTKL